MWGETTRVKNRGETTRGGTTRGETSWGRNVLLPQTLGYMPVGGARGQNLNTRHLYFKFKIFVS